MIGKCLFLSVLAVSALTFAETSSGETIPERRAQADRQSALGNFKNAAEIYRGLALDRDNAPDDAAGDLRKAQQAFLQYGQPQTCEDMLNKAIETWPESWRMLATAADLWRSLPSLSEFVDNEYRRSNRWTNNYRNSAERDRVRAIQLMLRAEKLLDEAADAPTPGDRLDFYRLFAGIVAYLRIDGATWRLTALSDLNTLPEYDDYNSFYNGRERSAPVDADGNPVLYPMPASWEAAENDGQRWRCLLGRMAAVNRDGADEADWFFASFLMNQFGVQTMGRFLPMARSGDDGDAATGAFAVRTLSDDETIARLATGLKRFAMPAEYNHIAIMRGLVSRNSSRYGYQAARSLAQVFENRQQYAKAVGMWQHLLDFYPKRDRDQNKRLLERITGANGLLEAGPVAPAGTRTKLSYLFRNGDKVALTAHRLDEKKLLRDIRRSVKANGEELFRNPAFQRPEQIGRIVVERNAKQYIVERTAAWEVALDPLPGHHSRRAQIEMPFDKAGCYLVEAVMAGGNTSRVVLWIVDLAMVRKPLGDNQIVFVADAVTGEPVADATVSFFGYERRHHSSNRIDFATRELAEKTDADGLVVKPWGDSNNYNWLISAETKDGRMAYLGFEMIWLQGDRQEYTRGQSAFIITDRPVYRPDHKVNFKVWLGETGYGEIGTKALANRNVTVVIYNPMGEKIYEKALVTNAHGGVDDAITLDANAPLGVYSIQTLGNDMNGYGSFRLEEYRKPEYEVTVETPAKALILGESAEITVKAAYYFGSPVADAAITYKVTRTPHENRWYPEWRWDWLYGSGSGWLANDAPWYPGWNDWGVRRPLPPWMPPMFFGQPELVAEGEGVLDADGIFRLPLDTAAAKELYNNTDHKYEIAVEVTDASRRVIAGSGQVVAARKPFAVTVWADRGYYTRDQEVDVSVKARLPLGGGVKATGRAVLHRIRYNADGAPEESEAASWDAATDGDGLATLRFKAGEPGQYRLSCVLRDEAGNEIEGAALLTVRGEKGEGDFRFAALELAADRAEYGPGDVLKLAVNSEKDDARVLLIPRVERGGGSGGDKPALLRLDNGSTVVDIPVRSDDQPNFFCEAITIHNGKVYSEVREIFVPPASKTLNVAVSADKDSYLPGEKATFHVAVTDADGKPVQGECVVTLYDKSVEYISGGSNVGDIRAHFWSWKRYYHGAMASSLSRYGYRVAKQGDIPWEPIGIFGGQEADWNDDGVYVNGRIDRNRSAGFGVSGPMPVMRMARQQTVEADMMMESVAAPAAPMAMAATEIAQDGFAGPEAKAMAPAAGGGEAMAEPQVRSEFADTALWIASLVTDGAGRATFSLDMPENLTAWKNRTWIMGGGTRVGDGETGVETRKNIIVRPQAPRFLTQKDQVVLSANLHNYLPRAKRARAELVLEGGLLTPAGGVELIKALDIPAGGEARVDWLVDARRPGEAKIVMKLLTDEESDAAEITVPVVVHGARTVANFGGAMRGGEVETVIPLRVPAERLPDQSRLELSFSPSIAVSLLEALPFLIEYPYGCTEQTLNRFLPVVMTRKYLENLGLSLADASRAVDAKAMDPKSKEWIDRFGLSPRHRRSPVFDDAELAAMVKLGVERLSGMQCSDGGWGWFSGSGESSWPHTTAVIVHGLLAAADNGAAVSPAVVEDGVAWLRDYRRTQVERIKKHTETDGKEGKKRADNLDAFIHGILVRKGHPDPEMRDFLYRDRLELSLSGLAMLGIALHEEKAADSLKIVLENLEQYLEEDASNGTSWLRVSSRGWWWWYNDDVETQAWYLKLLSRVDPKGERASGVAKYLLRNRKNGHYWRSTRDTAYAIEALTEFAAASGESAPDMKVAVFLDGDKIMERTLTAANLLDDHRLLLEGLAVETGDHELRIVRTGSGNLYYGGRLDLFSLEDPIARSGGGDLSLDRAYYRLIREDAAVDARTATGVAARANVEKYRRERIPTPFDGEGGKVALRPGDLVEVELTVETKNDFEYLVFEDIKAAGIEAVELRSGYTGNRLGAYVEYRDQKVVLFVRSLPRGKYSIAYRFRAETPGHFSALPAFGGGMYATDLFANSNEQKVTIVEEGVFEP